MTRLLFILLTGWGLVGCGQRAASPTTETAPSVAPSAPRVSTSGYIKYWPGTLPIVISVPHDGAVMPPDIPDRTEGVTVRDTYSRALAEAIRRLLEDDELLTRIPRLIVDGTGAVEAMLWVKSNEAFRPAATWPEGKQRAGIHPADSFEDPDADYSLPVFHDGDVVAYIQAFGHHDDIGGRVPGSMPGTAVTVFEEGLAIPPIKLYDQGKMSQVLAKMKVGDCMQMQGPRGRFSYRRNMKRAFGELPGAVGRPSTQLGGSPEPR